VAQGGHSSEFASTDNQAIASALTAMKQLIVGRGGYVHPLAGIEEQDGNIWVTCDDPLARGETLFKLPDSLLVPVDGLAWNENVDALELAAKPGGHSKDQAELLDMFLTIYNSMGKLAQTRNQARYILSRDTQLAAQTRLVRPRSVKQPASLAATFLQTRTYSSDLAGHGLAGRNCLIPLIDFINHHRNGSHYKQDSGWLGVKVNNSIRSNECFANYGSRWDPLDLAFVHGFVDHTSPYAYSVPLKLHLAGFGRFELTSIGEVSHHRLNPPRVDFLDDGLSLSEFFIDADNPHHAKTTLELAIKASGKRRRIADTVIARTIAAAPEAIHAENCAQLAKFRAYLGTRPDLPISQMLGNASHCLQENFARAFAGWAQNQRQ
jgi:hypothetical protein